MLGHTPKIHEFNTFSKVGTAGTLARRFGNGKWDNACVALGYTPPKRVPPPKVGGWNKGITRANVNLDELKYLYEIEGLSMNAIAKKISIGINTIRRRMDLAGIKVKRHHYTQQRQTVPETLLYGELERQRIPFMKQQPIDGLYVVDVLVPGAKIVIECDGDYWHRSDDKDIARRDQKKTKYLESRGYIVFRFWESEIKENVTKCVERISDVWRKYKG
jgi:very-short-patch-repair endonuclease